MSKYTDTIYTGAERTSAQGNLASTERKDAVTSGLVDSADKSGSSLKDPLFSLDNDNSDKESDISIHNTAKKVLSSLGDTSDDEKEFGDEAGNLVKEQSKSHGFKAIMSLKKLKNRKPTPSDNTPNHSNDEVVKNSASEHQSSNSRSAHSLGQLNEKKYRATKSKEATLRTAQSQKNQYTSRMISNKTQIKKKGITTESVLTDRTGIGGGLAAASAFVVSTLIIVILAVTILGSLAGDEDNPETRELTANERIVAEFLLGKGLDALHTAAIMGNIEAESEFNPSLIEKATGVGHGLCQWGGDGVRLEGLYAYTKSKGKDWTDIHCQLEYLWTEMTGKGDAKKYAEVQSFSYKHKEFLAITDLEEAVYYFGRKFERPSEKYAHWDRRINSAWNYYMQLGGNNNIIEEAKRHLGKPYVWGAEGPNSFDCSGFVYYVYNQCGIKISRTTAQGLYNMSTKLKANQAAPGDLVFFGSSKSNITHVGIFISKNSFIHAPSTGDVVKITKISVMNNTIGYGRIK